MYIIIYFKLHFVNDVVCYTNVLFYTVCNVQPNMTTSSSGLKLVEYTDRLAAEASEG